MKDALLHLVAEEIAGDGKGDITDQAERDILVGIALANRTGQWNLAQTRSQQGIGFVLFEQAIVGVVRQADAVAENVGNRQLAAADIVGKLECRQQRGKRPSRTSIALRVVANALDSEASRNTVSALTASPVEESARPMPRSSRTWSFSTTAIARPATFPDASIRSTHASRDATARAASFEAESAFNGTLDSGWGAASAIAQAGARSKAMQHNKV